MDFFIHPCSSITIFASGKSCLVSSCIFLFTCFSKSIATGERECWMQDVIWAARNLPWLFVETFMIGAKPLIPETLIPPYVQKFPRLYAIKRSLYTSTPRTTWGPWPKTISATGVNHGMGELIHVTAVFAVKQFIRLGTCW